MWWSISQLNRHLKKDPDWICHSLQWRANCPQDYEEQVGKRRGRQNAELEGEQDKHHNGTQGQKHMHIVPHAKSKPRDHAQSTPQALPLPYSGHTCPSLTQDCKSSTLAYVIHTPSWWLESYLIHTPADISQHLDSYIFHTLVDTSWVSDFVDMNQLSSFIM